MDTSDLKSPFHSAWHFVWQVIKPYRWWYVLMLQAPVLTAFYIFANNYSFKLIVDAFSNETIISYHQLLFPILLFIIAQITLDIVWRISDFAEWKAEPYARQRLLASAYNYVQYHSYSYFQNTPSGTVISKLKGLLDGYDNVFANIHHIVGKHFFVVIVSVFVLLVVNLSVFCFMLAWCVLVMAIMLPMAFKLNQLSNKTAESKHQVIGALSDNITNIFSLFYFAKRRFEHQRVRQLMSDDFVPSQIALYRYDFKFNMIGSVLYWFMLITVYLFMIYLRTHGEISTGDFLFVMLTAITISFDLWTLMSSLCTFLKEIGDFKSSFNILSMPHESVDEAHAQDFQISAGKIDFHQLSFVYNEGKPVFANLNLRIKPGEKIGLVGHSGAGKSTLISLLLKNFKPTSGQILIDDKPISSITSDSLRQQIALIPQDIMLFHRTIGENIGYAKDNATLQDIKKAAAMANMDDFIESLPEKYNTLVGERGVKLSGGQRQRIAIARAFLKNASIVILDEATSSLDSISEQEIQQSINDMLDQNKATVIAIAHRLSTIRHMDRIVVMEDGKIIEEGSFDELVNNQNSYFKKLWDSQVNGMVL
ncbi:ABC transporter ATP-binding protein [Legionella longbeachae]|uniref:ABC-type multidrug transport system, ATPase and permease components n=1 Tax=Legionella longbeachae serogroup 1 (strain NSW150) TaxID=661367 RepID=D3HSB2_LEGLN|nr:ABC transporter ATP-binding protein [Legionella longbeachae]VEE02297.1 multidrug ABC transporter ATPase/permease [Legionella oakridgensis]HBD7398211.1 ABC transporter ATP-binding protein [Legionella pneumophila]ARB91413.1 ABC transporter ATP-binding protein [Legionella longbeachae]ARM32160.1 ABC transporter ATP-binding protein [Legionella longbeachae]QIN32164.1 ATP-binding cassette domain-containing protein [Legionella longbeachae]